MTTTRPPYRKLTQVQTAQLFQFLDRDKDATRASTANAIAATATLELGFPVSSSNIATLRRGMGLLRPRKEKPVPERLAIGILARELIALRQALGSQVMSSDLLALAAA